MNGLIVTIGVLTASLNAGGYLAQEASLRRSILPTAELKLAARVVGPVEVSAGYGAAWGGDRFEDLTSSTTYHRVPLRIGARLGIGRLEIAGGAGPVLLGTRTVFDGGDVEEGGTSWQLGTVIGARIDRILLDPPAAGSLRGRLLVDVYLRGDRTDAALLLGIAWRFPLG